MKKLVGLLLVAALLCGCSVPVTPTANSGTGKVSGSAVADPTEATLPSMESYAEDTGLVVTVSMGAEFEMVLNMFHGVLEVNALNEAGEALLANIEPAGLSYRSAVEMILTEAQNQGLKLNLTMTAKAVGADSWTVASHHILTWPFENYRNTNTVSVRCNLIPAGKTLIMDSWNEMYIVYPPPLNGQEWVLYMNTNGVQEIGRPLHEDETFEVHFSPKEDDGIKIWYYPDGSFAFEHWKNNCVMHYTLYPDDSFKCSVNYYDSNGNHTQWDSISSDGNKITQFFEGDITIRSKDIYPDGSYSESTYFSNGYPEWSKWVGADGYCDETTYYENGNPAVSKGKHPDGSTYDNTFFENGTCAVSIDEFSDGSYSEQEYYENGVLKHSIWRGADGYTMEQFYDENGNLTAAPAE